MSGASQPLGGGGGVSHRGEALLLFAHGSPFLSETWDLSAQVFARPHLGQVEREASQVAQVCHAAAPTELSP